MSTQSILSQIQYTQLITVTHFESRIKNNFELIVKELLRKQSEDAERDKQISQLKDSLTVFTQRDRRGLMGKDNQNGLQTCLPKDNQLRLNPETVNDKYQNKETSKSQKCRECEETQLLTFDEMQQKILRSERQISQLKQFRITMDGQMGKLRKQLNQHVSNKIVHVNLSDIQSLLNQIHSPIRDIQQDIQLIKESQAKITKSLENLTQQNRQQILLGKEKSHCCDQYLSTHSDLIQAIQLKLQHIQKSDKNLSSLPTIPSFDISSLEDKINIAFSDTQEIKSNIKQIRVDINHLRSIRHAKSPAYTQLHSADDNKIDGLIDKIFLIKKDYQSAIKGMKTQIEVITKNMSDYTFITDNLAQLKLQISKKSQEDNTKKRFNQLDGKISWIIQQLTSGQQDDAMVGKASWYCLSCDRGLKQFRGKIRQHLVTQVMKGKKLEKSIEKETMNTQPNAMRYKSKSKVQLPRMQRSQSLRH